MRILANFSTVLILTMLLLIGSTSSHAQGGATPTPSPDNGYPVITAENIDLVAPIRTLDMSECERGTAPRWSPSNNRLVTGCNNELWVYAVTNDELERRVVSEDIRPVQSVEFIENDVAVYCCTRWDSGSGIASINLQNGRRETLYETTDDLRELFHVPEANIVVGIGSMVPSLFGWDIATQDALEDPAYFVANPSPPDFNCCYNTFDTRFTDEIEFLVSYNEYGQNTGEVIWFSGSMSEIIDAHVGMRYASFMADNISIVYYFSPNLFSDDSPSTLALYDPTTDTRLYTDVPPANMLSTSPSSNLIFLKLTSDEIAVYDGNLQLVTYLELSDQHSTAPNFNDTGTMFANYASNGSELIIWAVDSN